MPMRKVYNDTTFLRFILKFYSPIPKPSEIIPFPVEPVASYTLFIYMSSSLS